MPYMNCPTCGLSVRIRASYLALDHCPRCLARRRIVAPMDISDQPGGRPATPKRDDLDVRRPAPGAKLSCEAQCD